MFKKHLYVAFAWLFIFLQSVALSANAAIGLITPQMRLAQVGDSFTDNLTISSATPLVSVNVTGLPAGITFAQNGKGDIAFSGTPTVDGVFPISILVSNSGGQTQTLQTQLTVYGLMAGVTQISVGPEGNFYCAVADGGLRCWGSNRQIIGRGLLIGIGVSNSALIAEQIIAPNSSVTKVAMDGSSACFVINGGVQCLGSISQLLNVNGALPQFLKPVQVIPFNSGATDLALGGGGACAIVAGGVQCWQSSGVRFAAPFQNMVGEGALKIVQQIAAGSGVTRLRANDGLTCAVIRSSLQCWGRDFPISSDDATQKIDDVTFGSYAENIANNPPKIRQFFCIAANGGVRCQNDFNASKLGFLPNHLYQVIPEKSGVTQLFGGNRGTCALRDGALWCWGYLPSLPFYSATPIIARGAEQKITDMAVNDESVCIVADTKPRCYSPRATAAQESPLASTSSVLSTTVAAGTGVTDASMQFGRTCIVKNGGVLCSDNDALMPAGVNASSFKSIIAEGSGATKLSVFSSADPTLPETIACAAVADGLQCWGANRNGVLGMGSKSNVPVLAPVQTIAAGNGVTAVAVSQTHACAIVDAGLQCWGTELGQTSQRRVATAPDNSTGELGLSPEWVVGFATGVQSVVVGPGYTCAVQFGNIYCWGSNTKSNLNVYAMDTSAQNAPSAQPVNIRLSARDVVALSDFKVANNFSSAADDLRVFRLNDSLGKRICALDSAGAVNCWGGQQSVNCLFSSGTGPCTFYNLAKAEVLPEGSGIQSITNACGVGKGLLKCWTVSAGNVITTAVGDGALALVPTAVAYTNLQGEKGDWPCVIASGALSCFFTRSAYPKPVSNEYFAAVPISTLPDASPNRKPWFRVVGTPNELFVLTNNPVEYATLAADTPRYIAQGYMFSVPNRASAVNGAIAWPLYRLYRRDTQLPLWTSSFAEYQQMRTNTAQFIDEGSDGYVYKQANVAGTVPLYRFKRRNTGYEVLTTNPNEVQFFKQSLNWELLRDTSDATLGDAIGYVWP